LACWPGPVDTHGRSAYHGLARDGAALGGSRPGGEEMMAAASAKTTASLQGRTLRELLDAAESLEERLDLLPHVAVLSETVARLHEQGVVHRNLHPGNVLVTDHGETLVIDWGFNKVRGRQDPREEEVRRAANALSPVMPRPSDLDPVYLAPEMLQDHMEEVDAPSDVYALGATLCEILTGTRPTPEKGAHDVLAEEVTNNSDFVTGREGAPPQALVDVCRRALHKEPSARYATAGALAEDLRRFAAGRPAALSRVAPAAPRSGLVAGAVIVLLMLCCFTTLGYLAARRTRDRAIDQAASHDVARARAERALTDVTRRLEEARSAQSRAELERDQQRQAQARAQLDIKVARAALKKAEEERDDALGALARARAGLDGEKAAPRDTRPEGSAAEEEPGSVRPTRAEAPLAPDNEAAPRRPSVARSDLIDAIPHLITSLGANETGDGVVVRLVEGETDPGVAKLGFRDGDVITQVNRRPVATLKEAQRALAHVRKDPGFSARIQRNGQSTWMRVSFGEPVAETAEPEAPPAETPPQPDESGEGNGTPDNDAQ